MKLSHFALLVVFVAVVLGSCSTKPRHVLDEDKMIAVLQDLYLADGIMRNRTNEFSSNQQKDAMINGVLAKHKITQAELDSSLVWYADNIELYSDIQDTVSTRLQRRSDALSKLITNVYNYKLTGFSTELPEHYSLNINTPTFRFNVDSTKLGSFDMDKFEFSYEIKGIDSTLHRIESSVYYKYADTTVVDKRKLKVDSLYVFVKPQIADSLLKEVSGYVHMVMATEQMPRILICNIRNKKEVIAVKSDSISSSSDEQLLDEMLSEKK